MESIREFFKKYLIEVIFVTISLTTIVAAIIVLLITTQSQPDPELTIEKANEREKNSEKIYVDLAGAIENPDMYQLKSGARLKDILILAGGLSASADRVFFSKNFNLARILSDQEKIYIPSTNEETTGLITDNFPVLDNSAKTSSANLINVNTATMEELDKLPGIGKITAEKIIRGRPYQSADDLLNKKIVGKSVYENIKELINI